MNNDLAILNLNDIRDYMIECNYNVEAIDYAIKAIKGLKIMNNSELKFSIKQLKSWLYEIAINNINTDMETYTVEIISRLDGFERYVIDNNEKWISGCND